MTILDLKHTIEQIKQEGIPEGLARVTIPSNLRNFHPKVGGANALMRYAIQQPEYSWVDLLELYIDAQAIGMSRLNEGVNDSESMLIAALGSAYQNSMRDIIREAMRKAPSEGLGRVLDTYAKNIADLQELTTGAATNHFGEIKDRNLAIRVDYLNSQLANLANAYLATPSKENRSDFYFKRFEALVDYMLEHGSNPHFNQLLAQAGQRALSEQGTEYSSKHPKHLAEVIKRGQSGLKGQEYVTLNQLSSQLGYRPATIDVPPQRQSVLRTLSVTL